MFMILAVLYLFFVVQCNKHIGNPNTYLILLLAVYTSVTLISFLSHDFSRNISLAIKVLVVWFAYSFFISYLWDASYQEKFIKYATNIAIVANILLLMQFIAVSLGFHNFFNGNIPFLQLSKYNNFAELIDPNTGDTRVSSFFQEPSYFGIYCLPVFAQAIKDEKYKLSIFLFIGLIFSTSLLSILGGILVLLFLFFTYRTKENYFWRLWGKIALYSLLTLLLISALYNFNSFTRNTIDYAFNRVTLIDSELQGYRLASSKIRLIGYLELYPEYSTFHKIFGAGASQFSLLLSNYGVLPYSSTYITSLLNYGLIGFFAFNLWVLILLFKCKPDRKVFVLILFTICLVDNFWFNWYFFYILTWFMPELQKTNKLYY